MAVNYTPSRGDYKDLTPFRFWCQKVLPMVYDDSLSYYELLCKVVDYLNKTMEDVGTLEEDVTNIYSAYEQLQTYVNDYFDNLDVQDEIDNKLDRLVDDGTIHDIFNDDVIAILNQGVQARDQAIANIPANVTSWLNEHIVQESGYVIDDTLSVQGAAADAKATGDAVNELKSDLSSAGLGKLAYGSSGSKEVSTLTITQNQNTITLNGIGNATATQLNTKVAITPPFNAWNATSTPTENLVYPLNLIAEHNYKLTATVISGTRNAGEGTGVIQFRFIDNSENVLNTARLEVSSMSASCDIVSDGTPVRLLVMVARLIEVSNLAIRVVVEDTTLVNELNNKQNVLTFDESPVENSTNPVTSDGIYSVVTVLEDNIDELYTSIGYSDGTALSKTTQAGYYWNAETDTAVLTSISNWSASTVDISSDVKRVHVVIRAESSSRQYPVLAVDDELVILGRFGEQAQTEQDIYITIPEGTTKLLLTCYTTVMHRAQVYPVILNSVQDMVNSIDTSADYNGAKLSLLGDSFSAFEGYSTDGHNYYPSEASDVANVNQMWWKIVADTFNMNPLVIGGWSGSTVASGIRSSATYTPASDPSRCEALDDGTNTPDVILIAMGVNDYSYTESNSQFGDWDGTTPLGNASDLSDYDTATFKTAYATMLARIQKKYPNAFIICITPWFMKRRTTDTGANYLNAIGKSIADYAVAVKEICEIMHVTCIDGTNIGFNRYNYYPVYCQDVAGSSTHPNVAGQSQIAKAIIAKMKTIHKLGA